jgi:transcriptional regulator with XRE-family HTH domain
VTVSARPALLAARRARGWSQADAAREFAALAHAGGMSGAAPASLKSLLSRWENGHATPDAANRALLARLYGRSAAELGLACPDVGTAGAGRLRARLAAAAALDAGLLRTWSDQLDLAHRLDDEVGAAGASGVVRALVAELDRALVHATTPGVRARAAVLVAHAATLAGWQELDLGDAEQAWLRFARAREAAVLAAADVGWPRSARAASEPRSPGRPAAEATAARPVAGEAGVDRSLRAGGAHAARPVRPGADRVDTRADTHRVQRDEIDEAHAEAVAGQAAVLVDLGEADGALTLLGESGAGSGGGDAWLAAARGAAEAARGRVDAAECEFAAALAAGGGPPADDLRRWRGRALAATGHGDVVSELEAAIAAGIRSIRERAATHAALAVALSEIDRAPRSPGRTLGTGPGALGERAAGHARTARELAERSGSGRAIALLARGAV